MVMVANRAFFTGVYTAISKKVALVIHDALSMFHSPQCIMGAGLV